MPQPQFTVNSYRHDPYKNFRFRVLWDNKVVAGVSKVSALKWSTEPASHREGGDPLHARLTPTTIKFEPVTLERGITHDPHFETWAKMVYSGPRQEPSLKRFRKDVTIQLLNESGQVAKVYYLHRAWVSEYTALPELDANGDGAAFESLVLQTEGWERDEAVQEPTQT